MKNQAAAVLRWRRTGCRAMAVRVQEPTGAAAGVISMRDLCGVMVQRIRETIGPRLVLKRRIGPGGLSELYQADRILAQ